MLIFYLFCSFILNSGGKMVDHIYGLQPQSLHQAGTIQQIPFDQSKGWIPQRVGQKFQAPSGKIIKADHLMTFSQQPVNNMHAIGLCSPFVSCEIA